MAHLHQRMSIADHTLPYILALPDDVNLAIICATCTFSKQDITTLINMLAICRTFYALMWRYREHIVDHFTSVALDGLRTEYRFCGMLHRERDLPAVIHPDGASWYWLDKPHRSGKPAFFCEQGLEIWWWYVELHRAEDEGPAFTYHDGVQEWYHHGQLHRGNGKPARVLPNGITEYYLMGEYMKTVDSRHIYPLSSH